MKSPSYDSTVSISAILGGVSFEPVITRTPSLTANRPSSEAVLPARSVLPSRQPVRSLPLKSGLKPGSSARAAERRNVETRRANVLDWAGVCRWIGLIGLLPESDHTASPIVIGELHRARNPGQG